jgi:hypothetical protein
MSVRALFDVDALAGLGAATFAVVAVFVPELHVIAAPATAGGFSLFAFGRWYHRRSRPV